MGYKTNNLVHVERPEHGVLLFRKSRGKLTVEDITDALRDRDDESPYVLFLKATQFNGYLGEDHLPSTAVIHNLSELDNCPACGKSYEKMLSDLYDGAF
jgi:hypothetical protein